MGTDCKCNSFRSVVFSEEDNVKVAIDQISFTLFGVLYVAGLGGYFLLIRNFGDGERLIFFLLLIVWLGDIAAYYWGGNFGKKPLAPVVSPNKTMEGAIAGLAGSLAAGAIAGYWFLGSYSDGTLFTCCSYLRYHRAVR